MRKLLAYCAVLSLGATAACAVHDDTPPSPSGPSTNAISLTVTATPDTLPQNGAAQSTIAIKAFNAGGQPLANYSIHLDMRVNGATQDFGTLSARNLITAADGTTSAVYTAPAGPAASGLGTTVALVATPTSGDAANQGILNSVGTLFQAYVRLVADGLTNPPTSEVPTAQFTSSTATPKVGQSVLFNGTTSCASGLSGSACASAQTTLTAWDWDFGDGSAHGSGSLVSHTYANVGTYAVQLRVTNSQGNMSSPAVTTETVAINSSAAAPTSVFTATVDGAAKTATADGSRSTGQILNYLFSWGDGTNTGGTNPIVTHAYATSGTKAITLTVTDVNGNSASSSVNVVIP